MSNSSNDNEKSVDGVESIDSIDDIDNIDSVDVDDAVKTDSTDDTQSEDNTEIDETDETDETDIFDNKPAVKTSGSQSMAMFRTAAILGLITLITAFMLAALNNITSPVIQERKDQEKAQAVTALFGDDISVEGLSEEFTSKLSPPVAEILYVWDKNNDGVFLGYCVTTQPKGFGGKINIVVAVSPDEKIIGANILDMSETAGIGTQVREDSFLGQFKDKSDVSGSVDTISGATISSKAVLNGISEALKQIKDVKISASDLAETE